jgi:hypothetical protein
LIDCSLIGCVIHHGIQAEHLLREVHPYMRAKYRPLYEAQVGQVEEWLNPPAGDALRGQVK